MHIFCWWLLPFWGSLIIPVGLTNSDHMSECFPLLDNRIGWAHILQLISFSDYFFTLNLGLKQKRSLPENRFFTMHIFCWWLLPFFLPDQDPLIWDSELECLSFLS